MVDTCLQTLPHGGGDIEPSPNAVFLYNLGDECTELTGGWYQYDLFGGGRGETSFELTADHLDIYCYITTYAGRGYWISTRNNQDFSSFSKVYVDVQTDTNEAPAYWNTIRALQMNGNTRVAERMSSKIANGQFVILGDRVADGFQTELNDAATRSVFSYDISALQGTHRIIVCTFACNRGIAQEVRTKVYRIWLEP